MTPPMEASDEPDEDTWQALRQLIEANEKWRDAYQAWVRAGSDPREARALREAERRVAEARAVMDTVHGPRQREKSWSAH